MRPLFQATRGGDEGVVISSVDMAVPSDHRPRPPFGMMRLEDSTKGGRRREEPGADLQNTGLALPT